MKKSQAVKSWLVGINKFFKLHDYSKNMKSRIDTFNPKGK